MKIVDGHVHLQQPAGFIDTVFGEVTGQYGKLHEQDGSEFQYLPPYMKDSCFDADTLIATMDAYGIDQAVILAHLGSGVNEANVRAQRTYPDRLFAACAVSPYEQDAAEQLKFWNEQGIHIAKFEMRSMNELFGETRLTSEGMLHAIDAAAELSMTVAIDPGPCSFDFYHPEDFLKIAQLHPKAHFVMCHMGLPFYGVEKDTASFEKWKRMTEILKLKNVWTDTSAIPDVFDEEDYPYSSAIRLFRYIVDNYGIEKVIWGTDIPGTLRNATYPQMMRLFPKHAGLTEGELEKLFGANAKAAYKIN